MLYSCIHTVTVIEYRIDQTDVLSLEYLCDWLLSKIREGLSRNLTTLSEGKACISGKATASCFALSLCW